MTSIGDYAFAGCSSLTTITLPESVTRIGRYAFDGCSNLTSITIPKGVTRIEGSAFRGCIFTSDNFINNSACTSNGNWGAELFDKEYDDFFIQDDTIVVDCRPNVISVAIPEGVTSIGDYAFDGCSSLTAITLPEGVTSIGKYAFRNCLSLTAITIPEGVTSIGNYAFDDCLSLTAITLPESVTEIGYGAFSGCSFLATATIGDRVTELIADVFSDCGLLKELTLGKGLRKIEAGAFVDSESIEKVTIHATQPPTTDGYIFSNATYENATLYVPQGSISKYQVMTGWSGFYNISEIEGGTPDYLTLRQADNGEVGIAVDLGRTYKVRIKPSTGWKIHTVTFDGKDMTAQLADDNTFTTPTINGSAVLNVAYVKEGSAIAAATASRIKVQGHQGIISIAGTTEGAAIGLYTTSGTLVATATAEGDTTQIAVPAGQVYIVKVADTVVKIGM